MAHDFLDAIANHDEATARALWVHPEDFHFPIEAAAYEKPWAISFTPSTYSAQICRVQATKYLDSGCEIAWQLELEPRGDTWHVRSAEKVEATVP